MAGDLRIVVIGQAAFGEKVVNALVEKGENVVGVFCSPDAEGRPADPIKQAAEKHNVPVFQFRRSVPAEDLDQDRNLPARIVNLVDLALETLEWTVLDLDHVPG